jgi:hypothetical protein
MDNTWLKLFRKLGESSIFEDEYLLQLWIHILISVNYKKKKLIFNGKEIIVLPGSGIFGLNQIVTDIKKITNQKTKKFKKFKTIYYRKLKILEKLRKVKLQPTNKFTIISIVKWEQYQQNETQVKLNCNSSETQVKTNKKVKKVKKEEEKNSLPEGRNEIDTFCNDFISYIKKTKPTLAPKSKNIQKNSYVVVNQLINLDGYKLEQIIQGMQWAVKDAFWQDNIFSLASLRRKSSNGLTKFQNIINGMKKNNKSVSKINNQGKAAGRSFIERMKVKQYA